MINLNQLKVLQILFFVALTPQFLHAVSFSWDDAAIPNLLRTTGTSASFPGTVSGNTAGSTLEYFWEYSSDGSSYSSISNSSSTNVYSINSVVSGNNGFYRVTVSENISGTVTSAESPLAILTFIDTLPTVANAINAIAVENSGNLLIDLSSVFTDVDADDESGITKSVVSADLYSTSTVYPLTSATISAGNNNLLVLEIEPYSFGSANVIIRGTEGSESVDEAFLFVVTEDAAPTLVLNPISTINVRENAENETVSISGAFSDSDNDDSDIVWDAVSGDTSLVTISPSSGNVLSGGNLIDLTFLSGAYGSTVVTVTGNSNGKTIDGVVNVNVSFDQPPTVGNTITTVSVSEDDVSANVTINGVFADADSEDADADITWQASSSNTSLLTVNNDSNYSGNMYSDNILTLSLLGETGAVTVTVTGNSNGKIVSTNFAVDIDPVNDAPIVKLAGVTVSGNLTMDSVSEDEVLTFSSSANYLEITDDADASTTLDVEIYASLAFGDLYLNDVSGLSAVSGNGTGNITMTGNLTAIDAAVNGMTYVASTNTYGDEKLIITVDDLGNSGSGSAQTTSVNIDFSYVAVNDAPILYLDGSVVSGSQALSDATEETAFSFNTEAGDLTVSDLDPEHTADNIMLITLESSNSEISIVNSSNVTFTGLGNGTADVTVAGNITDLAEAMSNIQVTGSSNFSGSEYVYVTLSDNGVSGAGGALTASANFTYNILNTNDAPVLSLNTGFTLNEGDSYTLTSGNLFYTDSDNVSSEIILHVSSNVSNGTLNYSGGNFSVADISSSGVSYTHDGGETTSDSFTFDVLDGVGGNLSSQTVTMTILPVDDAPTLSTNTGMILSEGNTVVISSSNLLYADVDTNDSDLNFTLTSNVSNGTLSVNVASSGSGNFTMTELLSTGNLIYTHNGDETTSDVFEYELSDGNTMLSGNFVFTIESVNDSPVLSANTGLTVTEGGSALLASSNLAFTDVDNTTSDLDLIISSNVANGTLVFSGSGNFSVADIATGSVNYIHDGGETTSDSFTFDVLDGAGGNLTSHNFSIAITPVDDAPVLSANTGVTVAEGNVVVISSSNLLYTDADTIDSNLNFTLTSNVSNGTLSVNVASSGSGNFTMNELLSTGNLIYTHDGSETTSDTFDYQLSDGNTTLSGNFVISISAENDAPTLVVNNGMSVYEGNTIVLSSSNLAFTDVDNTTSELDLIISSNVANGTLVYSGSGNFSVADIAGGSVSYVHDGSETTSDSFTFDVLDGAGGNLASQTFSLVVFEVDDASVLSTNTGMTLTEGNTVVISSANLSYTDVDTLDSALDFTLTTNVSNGTLSVNVATAGSGNFTMEELLSSGNLIYTHDGGESSSDYFDYQLTDGNTVVSGNFSFVITPVNDEPVLSTNTGISVSEAGTVVIESGNLSHTDSDNSDSEIAYYLSSNVSNGSLALSGVAASGNFTMEDIAASELSYIHDGGETTSDSFTFDVLDGAGGNIASQTFSITIVPVDDASVLSTNTGMTLTEGNTVVISSANLSYTDVDTLDSALDFTLTTNVSNGTLSVNVATTGSGNFTMEELLSSGNLIYTHDGGESSSDYFDYQLTDGNTVISGNFSFVITPVNDEPVLSTNTGISVSESGTVVIESGNLSHTDSDNSDSEIAYYLSSNVSNGSLALSGVAASGNFTMEDIAASELSYIHDGGETTSDSFTFDVLDGAGGNIASQTFSITIVPVDDASVLSTNTGMTLTEGNTVVISSANLSYTDVDTLDSALDFTLTTNVSNGTLSVNVATTGSGNFTMEELLSSGNLIYTHDGGESSSDYFDYQLTDGNTVISGNFSFVIIPVNDEPVLSANTGVSVSEAGTVVIASGNLSHTDSDNSDSEIAYYLSSNVSNGSLALSGVAASGNFTMEDIAASELSYIHDGGETTSDSFTFDVLDGAGGNIASQTFSITIVPVDDASVLSVNTGMTLTEGNTVVISSDNLSYTDVDTLDSALDFTLTTNVSNGTLSVNVATAGSGNFTMEELFSLGNLIYTHDGGESSSDYFDYQLTDGNTVISGNFSFVITPVNDEPVLSTNTGVSVSEAGTVVIESGNLSYTDTDNSDTEIAYYLSSNVTNGSLVLSGSAVSGNFTMDDITASELSYIHDGGETTSDSFTFDVLDGAGGNLTSETFSITIVPVDDASVLSTNTGMTLTEGNTVVISSANLSYTDIDTLDSNLDFTLTTNVSNGTLSVNVATSGSGNFTMAELLSSGNLIYTHNGGETNSDYFDYQLSDGNTTLSGNFSFVVTPVNDNPILSANTGISVAEAGTVVIASANLSSTDPDNSESEMAYYLSSNVTNGILVLNGSAVSGNFTMSEITAGNLSYVHDDSETTSDSFSFDVLDGAGGNLASQIFNITVVPVDDASVLSTNTGMSLVEGNSVLISSANLSYTDIDTTNSNLNFTLTTNVTHGTLSLNAVTSATGNFNMTDLLSSGNLVYTHDGSETTSDSFDYELSDGTTTLSGSFVFSISNENDAPSISMNDGLTLLEGSSAVISSNLITATDPDNTNSEILFDFVSLVTSGNLYLSGNSVAVSDNFTQADLESGILSYTHDDSETTSDEFVVTITDSIAAVSSNITFSITVTPVNEAPVISGTPNLSVTAGAAYSFIPTATDVDTGDTLTFSIDSTPTWASFNMNTGELSGTPAGDDNGTYSLVITVTDSGNLSDSLASFDLVVDDGSNPVATVTPTNGSTSVDPRSEIRVQFDEAVYFGGTALADSHLDSLVIELKEGGSSGNNLSYTASVNSDSTSFTVAADFLFNSSANIYFAFDGSVITDVGNLAGQAESTSFITTGLSGDLPEIQEVEIAQVTLRKESLATLNLKTTQIPAVDEIEYFWINADDGTVLKTDIVDLADAIDGISIFLDLASANLSKSDNLQAVLVPVADSLAYYPLSTSVRVIENTAPTAPAALSYSPSQPPLAGTDLDLSVTGSTDVDSDSISYEFEWTSNGNSLLTATGSSPYTLASSNFVDGDLLKVSVSAYDGEDYGLPTSIYLTIGANAPIASISSNVSEAYANETVQFDASSSMATEVDSQSNLLSLVQYDFEWTGDGVVDATESSSDANFDGIVETSLSVGLYTVMVTVTDSLGSQSMASTSVNIINSIPVIDSIEFTTDSIDVTSDLGVNLVSSDVDGDAVSYSYRWFINDVEVSESSNVLSASEFSKEDEIEVLVTPNDGTDDGAVRSVATTVVNAAPVAPTVSVIPVSAITSDDLVATVGNVSDPDGDSTTVTYTWYKDEVVQSSQTTTTISSSDTTEGEVWRLLVSVSDNVLTTTTSSDNIGVGNVAPVINSISVSSFTGTYADNISVLVSAFDLDGDALTYSYDFNNDGTVDLTSTSANVDWNFVKGSYYIAVSVNDGVATGNLNSSSLMVIANTAPVVDAGFDLTINVNSETTVSGNGTDIDVGDEANFTYSWVITEEPNGSSISLNNAGSLDVSFTPTIEGTYRLSFTVSDQEASTSDVVAITVSDLFATTASGNSLTTVEETALINNLTSLDLTDNQDIAEALTLIFANAQESVSESVVDTMLDSITTILSGTTTGVDLGGQADLIIKSLDLMLPFNDASKDALESDDVDKMLSIMTTMSTATLSESQISESLAFLSSLVAGENGTSNFDNSKLRETASIGKALAKNLAKNVLTFNSAVGALKSFSDASGQIRVSAIPLDLSLVTSDVSLTEGLTTITLPTTLAGNLGGKVALNVTTYSYNVNRNDGEDSSVDPFSSIFAIDLIDENGNEVDVSNLSSSESLTITISFTPGLFVNADRPAPMYFNSNNIWSDEGITISSIDTVNNTVTFKVSHLTDFGVFEDTNVSTGLSGSGGGCLLK